MREQQFFTQIRDEYRGKQRRIILPESEDERIREAANVVSTRDLAQPVLLTEGRRPDGVSDDVLIEHCDPDDDLIQTLCDKRDITWQDANESLDDPITYAMTMVEAGRAHGVVAGANHPTKHTYGDALRIIGARDDVSTVSTTFILFWDDTTLFFSDCALNIDPGVDELVEITRETVSTVHRFDMTPRVAMLSYSSDGSGQGDSPEKVREATKHVRETCSCNILGEVQFDAAFKPSIQERKLGMPGERCNVYIFPGLDAANIGYKIAEHMGGATAVGPITQGLRKPVNDLSRGASVQEIIETIGITAYHD